MLNLDSETCFLIVSHNGNWDVLNGLKYNFSKYDFHVNNMFVLMNSKDLAFSFQNAEFISVKKGDWKTEMYEGLSFLTNLGYKKMILWLDDFYLTKKVDLEGLSKLLDENNEKKYLGLRRQSNISICSYKLIINSKVKKVDINFPYYTSLKSAYWDLEYFKVKLKSCENIWHFEKMRNSNTLHYEVSKSVISYWHTVEKGKWKYYTPILFKEEYNMVKGNRALESNRLFLANIDLIRFLKLKLIGY